MTFSYTAGNLTVYQDANGGLTGYGYRVGNQTF
jgi:hypothetical protein